MPIPSFTANFPLQPPTDAQLPNFPQPLSHSFLNHHQKNPANTPVSSYHPASTMEQNQQRRHLANMRQSLFDQGYLDEQFIQLEELQDDANPNFVEEVVTLFYRDSARILQNIEHALEKSPLDFAKLDGYMHQFKGSSSSIGAKKVKSESTQFRDYCRAGNAEGCRRSFQQLKKEYSSLKKKLEVYFQYARQAGPFEVACRPK